VQEGVSIALRKLTMLSSTCTTFGSQPIILCHIVAVCMFVTCLCKNRVFGGNVPNVSAYVVKHLRHRDFTASERSDKTS